MKLDRNTFEEILITITRNKTRSLLTAFGVFWGIFMLVTLLGGGRGLREEMQRELSGFATNSGFLFPNTTSEAYKGFRKGRYWSLELKDLDRLKSVEGIDVATANSSLWGKTAIYSDKKTSCNVKGLFPDYNKIEEQDMLYGRFINDVDIREGRKVCVIGKRVYQQLFKENEDPTGKYVKVDGIYYQVIGVNTSNGNFNINGSAAESITVPFSTLRNMYNMGDDIQLICFTVKKGYTVKQLEDRLTRKIKQAHYIAPDDSQAVMVLNTEAMFSMVDGVMTGINVLIWMVGIGTLFAGAIGVSNIMMVTVKERTTEIGIRRAIGAKPKDIRQQIMAETIVLTSLAGMAGISFAVFVLNVLEKAANPPGITETHYQLPFGLAILSCLILIGLGVLASLAPAQRALSIKPIDAIREE